MINGGIAFVIDTVEAMIELLTRLLFERFLVDIPAVYQGQANGIQVSPVKIIDGIKHAPEFGRSGSDVDPIRAGIGFGNRRAFHRNSHYRQGQVPYFIFRLFRPQKIKAQCVVGPNQQKRYG